MAALAVVSLGTTVFVAQRALSDASNVIVRGEGDSLIGAIVSDLTAWSESDATGGPPRSDTLEQELSAHDDEGLRYIALVDRDGAVRVSAGSPLMPGAVPRPGQTLLLGRRIRVAGMLSGRRPFRPREREEGGGNSLPLPFGGPARARVERFGPMAMVVVEFEPPVIENLRADLTRIGIVAAGAGLALLAFAFAWSRSAKRLAVVEQRAVREQRLVALGSMSSVMAHELRNPLASLKGHAQLLVEDLEEPKKRRKAERVVAEAERIELLTTSLLDFVRDGPIERASISPATLVEQSIEHLDAARIAVDTSEAPRQIVGDVARLSRAIHNLVDNALQADAAHPVELRVAARADQTATHQVVISVRDHGPGLPEGTEHQIFEPFVTTRVRGTGLGLAVARRIAEQHGGTLTGKTHPQGGALFELRLPIASDDP